MLFDTRRLKRKRIIGMVISWVITIGVAVLLAYILITYVAQSTVMPGESMKPTIKDGEKVLIHKMTYRFSSPKRYDVVVFESTKNNNSHFYIKRIIGLPGETVQIKDGAVYIDDAQLADAPFDDEIVTAGIVEEAITLNKDEYFVMGDNVNNSEDSRSANIGNINRTNIVGKLKVK